MLAAIALTAMFQLSGLPEVDSLKVVATVGASVPVCDAEGALINREMIIADGTRFLRSLMAQGMSRDMAERLFSSMMAEARVRAVTSNHREWCAALQHDPLSAVYFSR